LGGKLILAPNHFFLLELADLALQFCGDELNLLLQMLVLAFQINVFFSQDFVLVAALIVKSLRHFTPRF
jgi:hypothetical protein